MKTLICTYLQTDKWYNLRLHIYSLSVARGLCYFSTQESYIKNFNHKPLGEWLIFLFNSREWRNIVTHMGNWRRICFSHYLTRTLFQNPLADLYTILLTTCGERHETRHFNPLEDYRFFNHWFSSVKMP